MVETTTESRIDGRLSAGVGARLLARNTLLNIVGQVLPLLVNLATVPYVIRQLGADQFGILSLAWIVVGYFALFDLGIGPATTKFVADYLGRREDEKVPTVVWTALVSQACLGLLAGALLVAVTPLVVDRFLGIPPELRGEARWVFWTLAVSLPIGFATGSAAGVLSASQRFDLLNLINVPISCLTYLLPAAALYCGRGLRTSVALIVVARAVALVVSIFAVLRLHASVRRRFDFHWPVVKQLLGFGGWVALSGAVAPLLMYLDRFLLGAIVSMASVGFFTPPYMIASKLGILHGALLPTLFPAFCAASARGDDSWMRKALAGCVKVIVVSVGPAAMLLVLFARPILTLWVGQDFADEGAFVLQVLAIGIFFNAITHVPLALIQGIGRADLTAKLQIVQIPIHVALMTFLTWRFGLAGAAVAWASRTFLECILFVVAACRLREVKARTLFGPDLQRALALIVLLAVALTVLSHLTDAMSVQLVSATLLAAAFTYGAWRTALDDEERAHIMSWTRRGA